MIITIDGYSWLKKTCIGTRLAKKMEMDFLSTGLLVRLATLEYLNIRDKCASKADAVMQALERMKADDPSKLQDGCLYSTEVELEIKDVVAFPFVFPEIGRRISDWAMDKNIVLDGRRSFEWVPDADICFYFSSSIENRAALVEKVKRVSSQEAMEYINFRDSFEVRVTVPDGVIRIDPYNYDDDELIDLMVQMISKEKW